GYKGEMQLQVSEYYWSKAVEEYKKSSREDLELIAEKYYALRDGSEKFTGDRRNLPPELDTLLNDKELFDKEGKEMQFNKEHVEGDLYAFDPFSWTKEEILQKSVLLRKIEVSLKETLEYNNDLKKSNP